MKFIQKTALFLAQTTGYKGILPNNQQQIKPSSIPPQSKPQQHSNQTIQEPNIEQAQKFFKSISDTLKQNERQANLSKIQYYDQISSMQPIYLQKTNQNRLLEFELEIGVSAFEERIELHCHELNHVEIIMEKIIQRHRDGLLKAMFEIGQQSEQIQALLEKFQCFRGGLQKIQGQFVNHKRRILRKCKDRNNIRERIGLLTKIKQKNEGILLLPQNISQVFYTQRNRHKMYSKLGRITTVQTKTKCLQILRSKLLSVSSRNIQLVQEGIQDWLCRPLQTQKSTIQKLLILLYFMQSQALYVENNLSIDFNQFNKKVLFNELGKVCQWNNFKYIRDEQVKNKVCEFTDYLIGKISHEGAEDKKIHVMGRAN